MRTPQCDACLRKIKVFLNDNPEHSTARGSWRISDRKATVSFGYLGSRSIASGPSYFSGMMEVLGFLLFVTSATLFSLEWLAAPSAAMGRLRTGAAGPILGYTLFSLLSIGLMLEQTDHQLDALRVEMGALYFFALMYFFHRYFTEAGERYVRPCPAVMLMGIFTLCHFYMDGSEARSQSVLAPWGSYFRVTGFFNQPQSIAGNLGMAVFFAGHWFGGFFCAPQSAERASPFLVAAVGIGLAGCFTDTHTSRLGRPCSHAGSSAGQGQ